jgi:hypothetical protein
MNKPKLKDIDAIVAAYRKHKSLRRTAEAMKLSM